MRLSFHSVLRHTLALGIALPVLSWSVLPAEAQVSIRPTRTITSSEDAAAEGSSTSAAQTQQLPVAKITYDQLRKSYQVDTNPSLENIRADPKGNSGRVIELTGKVSGVMTSQGARNVILDSTSGTIVCTPKTDLNGGEFLVAGKAVRAIFLLSESNSDVIFTPLGVTDSIEPSSLFRAPYSADTTVAEPPMMDIILPQPQPAPQPRPVLRAVPKPSSGKSIAPMAVQTDTRVDTSQKATYVALARKFNKRLTPAQADEIGGAILSASSRHGLDPRFLSTVIAVESDFDIYCLSSSGAMGLGQLMPFNLKPLGITNAWSPTQNIHGSARMLRQNLDLFRDRPDATLLAVAAYNAGPNAVKRAGYKVPNGQRVQRYVWKVYNQYKALAPELFAAR